MAIERYDVVILLAKANGSENEWSLQARIALGKIGQYRGTWPIVEDGE